VWRGRGPAAWLARALLSPLALVYEAAVTARGAMYDTGLLATHALALPAVSVGNLTVGGTGKTPVAGWLVGELLAKGARPAVALRGYGADEPLVHEILNPGVPVVAAADRVAAVRRAGEQGADVVVLDDAFQHRRARREADVVLISADRWDGRVSLLPAGPWREPPGALRRATVVLVTRKAAPPAAVERVIDWLRRHAPGLPAAVAHLEPVELRPAAVHMPEEAEAGWPAARPLAHVQGARVLAVSAVGDPQAFERQLAALGAHVVAARYPDHHAFSPGDAMRLSAGDDRVDMVVCTLKDAVKLGRLWPRAAPSLWYVSQRVVIERGREELDRVLDTVLAARTPAAQLP
jgi:tetraacyldisaccharide 4'-kinase